MNLKAVMSMCYGGPEQMREIDVWYERFARFAETHPVMAQRVWTIHHEDEVYQARRRWIYCQGDS